MAAVGSVPLSAAPASTPTSVDSDSPQAVQGNIEAQRRLQNVGLLQVYNYYRVFLGAGLLWMFDRGLGERPLGSLDPDMFLVTVGAYVALNVLFSAAALLLPQRYLDRQTLALFIVTADILALTLLMHFSGGVSSTIHNFIVVSIAAGGILVRGAIATVLPAIASIAILYEEFYLSLLVGTAPPDFVNCGFLGAIYFATSLFIQGITRRLNRTEITAMEHAVEVTALERLNQQIVQRMRTGIVVLESDGTIRLMNDAGGRLLGAPRRSNHCTALPEELGAAWNRWQIDPEHRPEPFQAPGSGMELRLSFQSLGDEPDGETLVFVEDNSELQQRAQQLKMAALGRLSASIAHEIRNPLGAISHASQLLKESPDLDPSDERLTDIIQNHSRRMNGVIENVLELSRRRAPEPELLQLGPWLETIAARYREGRSERCEIEIRVEPQDLPVRTDRSQLEQVVTNLLANGLRHSEKEVGKPWVCLSGGLDSDSRRPFLDVLDQGPGVPEAQRKHLFEPFYTTETTGTGLGLYISRELCEANQVQITYRGESSGGGCFRLVFPHPEQQMTLAHD